MPVSNIYFIHIIVTGDKAFYATEAADIEIKNLKIISPDKTVYTLNNAANIHISNAGFSATAKTFLSAEGSKTQGVTITGTSIDKLPEGVKFGSSVPKTAVKV